MLKRMSARFRVALQAFHDRLRRWTRPESRPVVGFVLDHLRSPEALRWENALLRKQLEVACRQVRRPRLRRTDRLCLALLARLTPSWRNALLLIKPETILRWHRQGLALLWRRRSRQRRARPPRISDDTTALIQRMARDNALWGAERIRGELLKLGIRVSKRTIQKYLNRHGIPRPRGTSWATFLRAHGHEIWACDFLQVYDLLFRPIFAFFIIDLTSRRVVHSAVTRSPSSAWVAQQLREATAWGEGPRFLIRDNDSKFGSGFDALTRATGIQILRTPVRAPNANAVCERFLRSVRAECLDHLIILGERSLASILRRYCRYFNNARPHQGIGQKVPDGQEPFADSGDTVVAIPILDGLHHEYRRAA